jgi:hypothetical protein
MVKSAYTQAAVYSVMQSPYFMPITRMLSAAEYCFNSCGDAYVDDGQHHDVLVQAVLGLCTVQCYAPSMRDRREAQVS